VDGAHNVQSITALFGTLKEVYPDSPLVVAFGCGVDKDFSGMLKIIRREAAEVVFTRSWIPRAMLPEDLAVEFKKEESPDFTLTHSVTDAILEVRKRARQKNAVAVITGSLYVAGEALKAFGEGPKTTRQAS